MSKRVSRAGIAALLMASASASAVSAQSVAADGQADGSEEVIVTAQKRAQSPLDVGISIDAASAAAVREQRIQQVQAFVAMLPNVDVKEIGPGALPVITMRGVGLNDWSPTNNPSAGVYIDEVYVSSLTMMSFDLFDIERLESLKGPQGTLYGRNSTAGAINILTARPNMNGISGYAAASYGNYETAEVEGWINLPVSETFALRFSAKGINQSEGYFFNRRIDRDYGRRDILMGRAQARWQPSEALDINLKLEGQRSRSEAGNGAFYGAFYPPNPPAGLVCPGDPRCLNLQGYSDADGDPFSGSYSVDPTYDLDLFAATLTVRADLGGAELTSVTGYADFERQWGQDVDNSPLAIADYVSRDDISQFSQEFRLAGEAGAMHWLVGGFFSRDWVKGSIDGDNSDFFNTTTLTLWDQATTSAAMFGNLEYAVSDSVSLIGGLRYTWEERAFAGSSVDLATGCPVSLLSRAPCGSPPVTLAGIDTQIDDRNWSWKVGANWKPDEETLIYASISQGVKSGGFFSGFATNSLALRPYAPETLIAYEVGVKQRLSQSGFNWSASAFYYQYDDMQTFIRDESGAVPIQKLGNVKEVEIYGLDLEVQYQPRAISGLSISGGLGLLETEMGAFPSSGGIVPRGNRVPNAPEVSFNLGVSYEADLSGEWFVRLQTNGRYSGGTFKDAQNLELLRADSYWVWNARVAVGSNEGWEIALWGKNIADAQIEMHATSLVPLGFGARFYAPPRTFGLSVSKGF